MNNIYSEALYNEKRNAIPSWQGYEYQGNVAIRRYLEIISGIFSSIKEVDKAEKESRKIELKIEWLEDFIVFEQGNISEIYQVKKTLTKSNKKEVIANFILQYKFLTYKDIKWYINFDELDRGVNTNQLSEKEFDNIYSDVIEKGFIQELELLMTNNNTSFWKENLKLSNSNSKCKKSRGFLQKIIELKELEYKTQEGIEQICKTYIVDILGKSKKTRGDYKDFVSRLKIQQIPAKDIKKDCIEYIKKIPKTIRCNKTLLEEDILQKMVYDLKEKLDLIKKKRDKENYIYQFDDIKKVCRDEENIKSKWRGELLNIKEKFLKELVKKHCESCTKNITESSCLECIYSKIKDWDMEKLIDYMNLEYPNFNVKNAEQSLKNKLTDVKTGLLMDIIEKFQEECRMRDNSVMSILNDSHFVSSVIKRRDIEIDILSNYWDHTKIYREYESILTSGVEYELNEDNISFLKEHYEKENGEISENIISFLDTRKTKFVDWGDIKL